MSVDDKCGHKILIVDDSDMNRAILSEMLGKEYNIIEAEDGAQAIAMLQKYGVEISLVLLDVVMPVMNGYEVLEIMNSKQWIENVPVIMISTENTSEHIERAYELGVTDFISRPFDAQIVRRRVVNTILLYAKQNRLEQLAANQIYEKEKNNNLMIGILSHIVEFRNGESGLHVVHVQNYTEILLRKLLSMTDKYKMSNSDVVLISHAAALHDIGKITIPDAILNKPGRLTDEEFAIMKSHSMAGANILDQLEMYRNEPLVKAAYEISRWHHERYDGRGYPDGLKGDDIPISAQIVALADVYDALTSDRVYKKAFSHEKALDMILNGECGTFNPLLMDCLRASADAIKSVAGSSAESYSNSEMLSGVSEEMMRYSELSSTKTTLDMLKHARTINTFFSSLSNEIMFDYTASPSVLTFMAYGAEAMGLDDVIANPLENKKVLSIIEKDDLTALKNELKKTTPEYPVVDFECDLNMNGKPSRTRIICRSTWSTDAVPQYMGVIGKIVDQSAADQKSRKEFQIS